MDERQMDKCTSSSWPDRLKQRWVWYRRPPFWAVAEVTFRTDAQTRPEYVKDVSPYA